MTKDDIIRICRAADHAIEALRAALAQPEQEPVLGVVVREELPTLLRERDIKPTDTRLYTPPPQRKPLTDEEIYLATNHIDRNERGWAIKFARAIERAHGIGEKE